MSGPGAVMICTRLFSEKLNGELSPVQLFLTCDRSFTYNENERSHLR